MMDITAPGKVRPVSDLAVAMRGACFREGDAEVLRDITLEVRRGQVFGLLGGHESGKTTLIRLLAGAVEATTGSVRVFSLDPGRDRATLGRRVAGTTADATADERCSASEVLATWSRGMDPARSPEEVLGLVGLTAQADVALERLSRGKRRHLDLARAMLTRPELVLLDEPTAGLDPTERTELWSTLRRWFATGPTAVIATRHPEEAAQLTDRVGVLARGRLISSGRTEEIVMAARRRFSFRLPSAGAGINMPQPIGVTVTVAGNLVTIAGPDLDGAVDQIMFWAHLHSVPLREVEVGPATMQEIVIRASELSLRR
jgi:ABC-2 type transport system ATP-binding protein